MYINKIYLHTGLAFGSLLLSVIFSEENERNVAGTRYLFAIAIGIVLTCAGLIWASIAATKPDADSDKTITLLQADLDNILPFPNPLQKQPVSKDSVEVSPQGYDQHVLANDVVYYALIGVVCLIYHLIKNNLLVLIWFSAYTVIATVTSPLFQVHVLRQHFARPFRVPNIKDDFHEIKKLVQQAQRELKNELKLMGDDINGPTSKKKKN